MEKLNSKILTVQDLSCVGQCSLTVALPILSSYGLETAVLPTAILSEHTMFKHWTFLDLAENMKAILQSWKAEKHTFGAVYTGYLGRKEHFAIIGEIIDSCLEKGGGVFIDPAFGDNGKIYAGFDMEYVEGMRKFIQRADVILPNFTEAYFLLGEEYTPSQSRENTTRILRLLSDMGGCSVVLTGVEEDGKIGFASLDKTTGDIRFYLTEKLKGMYHGTGDIYASAFTGAYLTGKSLFESGIEGAEYVKKAIANTEDGHPYGVRFERVIAKP